MAFDFPVEADRVDDFNILAVILRAPVKGFMWIIGEDEQDEAEREERLRRRKIEREILAEASDYTSLISPNSSFGSSSSLMKISSSSSGPQKTIPRMLGSDLSYSNNDGSLYSDEMHKFAGNSFTVKKTKKKLSWSDENCKSLVEFGDESALHEPKPAAEPRKSSMSRSRSINSNANRLYSREEQKTYPNSMAFSGPTSGAGGGESPSWGWHTMHHTPPTPEYYYSRPHRSNTSSSDTSNSSSADSSNSDSRLSPVVCQPNPVFKILRSRQSPGAWNVPV